MTEAIPLDQTWMTTFSGVRFSLFDPKPELVRIEDIAHSLSQLCRFTGHTNRFYSVCEHSLLAAKLVPAELALEALLHDAHEAYTNDLSRPMKKHPLMTGYNEVSHAIDRVIRQKFGLPETLTPAIKDVDNKLVCTEAEQLMTEIGWIKGHPKYDWRIPKLTPEAASERFLRVYDWLVSGNGMAQF